MRHTRPSQLSLISSTYHNRQLFSDYYLEHRLQALEEWKHPHGLEEAFRKIQSLYRSKAVRFTARTNESQTEDHFIKPVLKEVLGWEWEAGETIPGTNERPDYALFLSEADRLAADRRKRSMEFWQQVPALGDAKRWEEPLERWGAKLTNYLYRAQVRWGILTNGRLWRLYEREKSRAGGVYYEIDLAEMLQQGDLPGQKNLEAFKYFYLFFRREALIPTEGTCFLERVFQGSVDYATEVGDSLKESVYDALRILMNGLFAFRANRLDCAAQAAVCLVHQNSLILLYRLLFLLYAEDRGVLPTDDSKYETYSLKRLHQEINQNLRHGTSYSPEGTVLWGRLTSLFRLIDRGMRDGGRVVVPPYNGGLFRDDLYPSIAHTPQSGTPRWEIGDNYLAEVVDMLAYRRQQWNRPGEEDIDYTTLDVQHLGSIYEGLLELKPMVAAEPLVEQMRDGKPVVLPQAQVPNARPVRGLLPRTFRQGEIYLATDRGERKATGSYYTPKYIVDYIVQNTIGPLAEEAASRVKEMRPAADRRIAALKRRDFADERARQGEMQKETRSLPEPYLSLKILDPAMGSGHFLVGAADFLSLAMATDPNLVAPIDAPADGENLQAYYKRLVVEHCLYGVDLNPLAVELAKVSLWLHTVQREKALSFLDHHLRCGNSLIGARIEEDLSREPPPVRAAGQRRPAKASKEEEKGQKRFAFAEALTAQHLQYFLDTFRRIVEAPTGDAEKERQKDQWYRDMDAVRDGFRQVANLWLAPYFGQAVSPEQYEQAVSALRDGWALKGLQKQAWFRKAQEIARQHHFFHWELEFPEVFFEPIRLKPKGERGFHTVIANPPWVSFSGRQAEPLELGCRQLWIQQFQGFRGWLSTQMLFVERAVGLLVSRGRMGFVVPLQMADLPGYSSLRALVSSLCDLPQPMVELSEKEFEGVTEPASILLLVRNGSTRLLHAKGDYQFPRIPFFSAARLETERRPVSSILEKVERFLKPPEQAFGDPGVHTGNSAELLILPLGAHCEETEVIVPLREGRDIFPYVVTPPRRGLRLDAELPPHHYATIRPKERYYRARILIRQTADRPIAAFHDPPAYFRNSVLACYGINGLDDFYLLAVLNSRLVGFWHQHRFRDSQHDAFPQVKIGHLRQIGIPQASLGGVSIDARRTVESWITTVSRWLDETSAETREGITCQENAE